MRKKRPNKYKYIFVVHAHLLGSPELKVSGALPVQADSVVICRPPSLSPLHNFKVLLVWNHCNQISYVASRGWGDEQLFKWSWSHDYMGTIPIYWKNLKNFFLGTSWLMTLNEFMKLNEYQRSRSSISKLKLIFLRNCWVINLIWKPMGEWERKFIQMSWVTWPRSLPCPHMVKPLKFSKTNWLMASKVGMKH